MRRTLLSLPLLVACTADAPADPADTAADVDAVDHRFDIPAAPAEGLQWVTEDQVLPPFSEVQTCLVDTYEGPDVGASSIETFQAAGIGHHVLFWTGEVDPLEYPDGSTFDCLDPTTMDGWLPLFIVEPDREEGGVTIASSHLPEGMGSLVRSGTRIVIQSHYINTSAAPVLVRDAVNFTTMPEDEVEVWAAPWGLGLTDMPLPAGEDTTYTFECEWPEDVQVLTMFGHMHERGTAMYMDHATDAGTERLYEVAEWDPEYRDTPPIIHHELPGLSVKAGDVSTTSCSFFNSEDHELDFPYEMCAMTGMMYPSRTPMFCNPREVR